MVEEILSVFNLDLPNSKIVSLFEFLRKLECLEIPIYTDDKGYKYIHFDREYILSLVRRFKFEDQVARIKNSIIIKVRAIQMATKYLIN